MATFRARRAPQHRLGRRKIITNAPVGRKISLCDAPTYLPYLRVRLLPTVRPTYLPILRTYGRALAGALPGALRALATSLDSFSSLVARCRS